MRTLAKVLVPLCVIIPTVTWAIPIAAPGTEGEPVIVNTTDDVVATYQGNTASYSNDLYVGLEINGTDTFVFNNHTSPVGSAVNLGSFPIGTELIFRLHVNNTGNDFFSGPGERNPDGQPHARAQNDWQPDETLVSFEDLFNGPFHYNDLSFSFTNTSTAVLFCDAAGPYHGDAGIPLQFDASNSFDTDGEIVAYDWNFGDGSTGSGMITTHTYVDDGDYYISLCVTDDDGNVECCVPESPAVATKETTWGGLKSLYR